MTTINIISGFLGAGKTTLIKKLLSEALQGQKVVLIENEFGEIGIDGGFLKEAGVEITEMNSGCICCSLVGDFGQALRKVLEDYHPDRILIEPSGVGKLSDVTKAVQDVAKDTDVSLGAAVTVADAGKCAMYMKNFGEFFNNQIENAGAIVLSRTQNQTPEKLAKAVALLKEHNPNAPILTTNWEELTGAEILKVMEGNTIDLAAELMAEEEVCPVCGHHHDHDHEHHHHHDHDDCCCDHDHEHHHHHDHEEHEHHHDHEHHHHHDGECSCGCGHDHHDHHHHHADEVFQSWGAEGPKTYTQAELEAALAGLDEGGCGIILRAKGIVPCTDGGWLHFDYVPGEAEVRTGAADYTGRLCVIGSNLDTAKIAALFGQA
ncbi:MAG: GTP-binding protein [Oscillospiraceae bacterium]|nr:GTP-binding protein [Oscillospiraceae bacterium]